VVTTHLAVVVRLVVLAVAQVVQALQILAQVVVVVVTLAQHLRGQRVQRVVTLKRGYQVHWQHTPMPWVQAVAVGLILTLAALVRLESLS
tara:strand:+ start:10684 stop:10953 length:270 start_codon:yes stop_codon:yes gene_type:complete